MIEVNEFYQGLENRFGLITAMNMLTLHAIAIAAGSEWDLSKPKTINIPVNKDNAEAVYLWCKSIRSGYNKGVSRVEMKEIKAARSRAHKFLYDEANDPNTSLDRKIQLVKLTSKGETG